MGKRLTIGSILNATVDSRTNNGESVAPAIVTRIHKEEGGQPRVDLRVFLDTGADRKYGHIPLVDKKPDHIAEAYPEKVAFWPSDS